MIKPIPDIPLESLVHVKSLGAGQFGSVFLIADSKRDLYALKSISRAKIAEFNIHEHMKVYSTYLNDFKN